MDAQCTCQSRCSILETASIIFFITSRNSVVPGGNLPVFDASIAKQLRLGAFLTMETDGV
jgi:hypothetical protein